MPSINGNSIDFNSLTLTLFLIKLGNFLCQKNRIHLLINLLVLEPFISFIIIFCLGESHSSILDLCSLVTPGHLCGLYSMLEIELRSTTCKATILPIVFLLQSQHKNPILRNFQVKSLKFFYFLTSQAVLKRPRVHFWQCMINWSMWCIQNKDPTGSLELCFGALQGYIHIPCIIRIET